MTVGARLGRRDVDDPSERFETAAVRFSEACEEAIRAIEDFIALYSHPEIQAQEGKEQDMKFEAYGVVNSITGVIFDLRQKVEASEVDVNGEGLSITFTVPVDQAKNLFGKVAKITVEVEE